MYLNDVTPGPIVLNLWCWGGKNQIKPPLSCYQSPAPAPQYSCFFAISSWTWPPYVSEASGGTLHKRSKTRLCFWLLNPVSSLWPYIFLCQASQGHQDIQHRRPALQKEAGTMVPAGPYPGWGDTAGASLTNCPCLATWERGECGNCIFPSNCICHMCGLLLPSQVWGPSQWCVKPNSWTLTCTTRTGCARGGR